MSSNHQKLFEVNSSYSGTWQSLAFAQKTGWVLILCKHIYTPKQRWEGAHTGKKEVYFSVVMISGDAQKYMLSSHFYQYELFSVMKT